MHIFSLPTRAILQALHQVPICLWESFAEPRLQVETIYFSIRVLHTTSLHMRPSLVWTKTSEEHVIFVNPSYCIDVSSHTRLCLFSHNLENGAHGVIRNDPRLCGTTSRRTIVPRGSPPIHGNVSIGQWKEIDDGENADACSECHGSDVVVCFIPVGSLAVHEILEYPCERKTYVEVHGAGGGDADNVAENDRHVHFSEPREWW